MEIGSTGFNKSGLQEEEICCQKSSRKVRFRLDTGRLMGGPVDPTTLDASAFGFLINTIGCPIESPLKEYGLAKNNLRNYVDRIKAKYFADLPQTPPDR